MYLRDSDEAEVLLRLIDDCDRLVETKAITGNAAFSIVSEAAKHHSDHPALKRRAEIERQRERAEVLAQPPAQPMTLDMEPDPVPIPDVA